MTQDLRETLFQFLEAAGAENGVVYLSVPVTSGQRELRLMRKLHSSPEKLRVTHRDHWLREVVEPNKQDARIVARQVRSLFPDRLVIDPSPLDVARWTQEDYQALWAGLIEQYAMLLVAAPGWAWSRGCRLEMRLALQLGIGLANPEGQALEPLAITAEDRKVRSTLQEEGWTEAQVDAYLPDLGPAPQPTVG